MSKKRYFRAKTTIEFDEEQHERRIQQAAQEHAERLRRWAEMRMERRRSNES